jgi:hypothetical protein
MYVPISSFNYQKMIRYASEHNRFSMHKLSHFSNSRDIFHLTTNHIYWQIIFFTDSTMHKAIRPHSNRTLFLPSKELKRSVEYKKKECFANNKNKPFAKQKRKHVRRKIRDVQSSKRNARRRSKCS